MLFGPEPMRLTPARSSTFPIRNVPSGMPIAEAAAIAIEECTAAQRSLVPAYDRLLAALAAVQDCMNQIYARTKEIKGEVLVDWNAIA